MSVGGIGARSRLSVQSLVDMRRQLDDLQRQLGTGKKSTTYAGMGVDRGLAVGLRTQLAALRSYGETITLLGVRLDLSQNVLTRMTQLRGDAKAAVQQTAEIKTTGQSAAQEQARSHLDELLELLNTQIGDRHLFSGRSIDTPAVETSARVLDGDGARAGFKQIIAERLLADLGAAQLGRVAVAAAAGTLTLAEDAAGSPFGFKLAAATMNLTGTTVTGPAGAPPSIAVAFAANPNAGESITFMLNLPDGSEETITLKATTSAPPQPGAFTIGPDPTATAANLQAVLTTALNDRAKTSLAAASALAAADDFFNIGAGNPPRRVAGPPFDSAVALNAGTAANTVFWYTGEMAADPARSSSTARVDGSISVSYGMRANEEGIRWIVQNVAAFAAVSFNPADASSAGRYGELTGRLTPALSVPLGTQRIEDIATDLAGAQLTIDATSQRHQQTNHVLGGLLDRIESVPPEQTAAEILALQTRLQASLQTTASLYQLSLVDYI